jgi:hypothetical protein
VEEHEVVGGGGGHLLERAFPIDDEARGKQGDLELAEHLARAVAQLGNAQDDAVLRTVRIRGRKDEVRGDLYPEADRGQTAPAGQRGGVQIRFARGQWALRAVRWPISIDILRE